MNKFRAITGTLAFSAIFLVMLFAPALSEAVEALVEVTKTAETSFTRTFSWTVDKSVTPETWDLFTGDSGTSRYIVTAEKTGFTDGDWAVSGLITVSNTTPFDASIDSVTDEVSGGIIVAVDCGVSFPYTLPAGSSLTCTYSSPLPDGSDRVNTATVTTSDGVAGDTHSTDVIFGEPTTVVNDTVTVVDTNGLSWTFGDTGSVSYERTFACSGDQGAHFNVATIVETGQSDDASVTVNCYELQVTKDVTASSSRQWYWTIDKSADQTDLVLGEGQLSDVNYEVTLDASAQDSGWALNGQIFINNSNPSRNASLIAVSDLVSPDIAATVNCPSLTVPSGGSLTCSYSSDLPDAAERTNTATATLQNISYDSGGSGTPTGTTDFSGSAPVTFPAPIETDACIDVSDTNAGFLGTVCANASPATFSYGLSFGAHPDADIQLLCGDSNSHTNTASFVTGDTGTTGSDDWTVNALAACKVCRSAGFWGTHAGEECPKKKLDCGSQNITQAVIRDECDESCLEICGESITNTDLDSGNSALEAMCISPAGGQRLQLASQLTAMSLNCCASVHEGDCEGLDVWSYLFAFCNSVCSLNLSDSFSYCTQALDCLNKGGNPITLSEDPLTVFCQTGTCLPVDSIIPTNNNTFTLACNEEIACGLVAPGIVDGPDPVGIVCRPIEEICTECVPFEETCHTQLFGICDDGSICTEVNTMGRCANGVSCDAENPCADFSECQPICDSDGSVCKSGPAGSTDACTKAIGDGRGKKGDNDCAILPKASSDECSKFNQGEECCGSDDEAVCEACEHDLCETDVGLDLFCDPCVTAVCLEDPFCCDDETGQWDSKCVNEAVEICGISCFHPAIDIEKATNGEDADDPPGPSIAVGDPVLWTYFVTNTGDVALSSIAVVDDQGVAVSCPKTALASGESMTCTASGTAVSGQYANVGTASAMDPSGTAVEDSDPSHYFGEDIPN